MLGLFDAAVKTGQLLHKAGPHISFHIYFAGKLGLSDVVVKRGQLLHMAWPDIKF
jgi:hypothetical protein